MKLIASLFLMFATGFAMAECTPPTAPESLPDGATSDLETMLEGQKAVKAFDAATNEYLDCLTAEGEAAADEETPEQQLERVELHNAAVDQAEAVAAKFNEEIREYKAKSQ
jgi:hypothetical protein